MMFKPVFSTLENYFELILDAIREAFSVEYGEYDNLGITELTLERIRVVVIAVFLGMIVGIILTVFNKRVYSGFVRSLVNDSAYTPETAKTLGETGYLKNPAVTFAIRSGNVYKGVLHCVEAEEFEMEQERRREVFRAKAAAGLTDPSEKFKEAKYRYDFSKDRFYIPEEDVFEAEEKFRTKGTSPVLAVILTVIILVALYFALRLLPDIIMLINNFVGMMFRAAE